MLKFSTMKYLSLLFATLFALSANAQTPPWSYVQQGTADWPGATTKDLVVSGDSIYAFGDIGLIDIMEGALTFTKLHADGSVQYEYQYDKPGTLEAAQRVTVHPEKGFLTSSILMPVFRPYFQLIGWDGTEIWNSASWSDLLPENSASQTYAYALPTGEVACIVADDIMRTITRFVADANTGALTFSTTINYDDIVPFDPADVLTSSTADLTHDETGRCIVIAGFNIIGTDTTDYIFSFDDAFTFTSLFGLANGIPQLALHSVIINDIGNYVVTGSRNSGAFFDLYSPVIITVDAGFLYSWTTTFDPVLAQAMAGAITQTADGNYKWVWYNMSGAFYDPAVGDFVDVVTIENWTYDELSHHTVQYAPYDIFECIVTAPDLPSPDDAYIIGGSSWEIGVPSYQTVISAGAADAMPECIFNCVWPGDADNSGVADMDDLLAIGLGFGATGPARDAVDISWYAHAADAWATALPGDINHKYTDCNGDGVIDAADELAVDMNYGLDHPVYTLRLSGGELPLYFAPDAPLAEGVNSVPIFLGNVTYPADAIYGIRFTATVTGASVDTTSVEVTFTDSWMGETASMLQLSKTLTSTPAADAATVRTDQNNAAGFGQIGTLNFVVIDNIAGKLTGEEITLDLTDVRAITAENIEIPIAPEAFTAEVGVFTNELQPQAITLYPNPVQGNTLYCSADIRTAHIELLDMFGRICTLAVAGDHAIQLPSLPAGEYIIRITGAQGVSIHPLTLIR